MNRCQICLSLCSGKLCGKHDFNYIWDSSIQSFRLKKKNSGSRYTKDKFHAKEIILTKILEDIYGQDDIFTGLRPLWATTEKGSILEYDILVKSKNLLIEYNGVQHYEFSSFFHKEESVFKEQQKRDILKIQLAGLNDYNMMVVRHDEPLFKDYIYLRLFNSGLL